MPAASTDLTFDSDEMASGKTLGDNQRCPELEADDYVNESVSQHLPENRSTRKMVPVLGEADQDWLYGKV